MADLWRFWDDALAGNRPVAAPDDPQLGFYRLPRRDGYQGSRIYEPVAYYLDDARTRCCRVGSGDDARDLSPDEGADLWQWVCEHAVTEEQYRDVAERGKPWFDEHALVGMQGHNRPPKDLSYEALSAEIQDLAAEAKRRLEGPRIESQDECDQVANLADRLTELHKAAERLRHEEERPWRGQLETVKARWEPLIDNAAIYRQLKFKLITSWLQRRKRAAAEAAARAAAAGVPVEVERPTAGSRGRAMSLRETKMAKIVDYRAALEFFADGEVMHDLVQDLANKAVRNDIKVPGVEVIIETKAV